MITRHGCAGRKKSYGRRPEKIWLREETKTTAEGERLQVVSVYLTEVKGSQMVFLEK